MIVIFKDRIIIKKIAKTAIEIDERGMFVEVDLDYPQETHKLYKYFPWSPDHYKVTYNELTPNESVFVK